MKVVRAQAVEAHEQRKELLQQQHEEMLAALENEAPQAVTLKQNKTGKPKVLDGGVVVMPDDYHYTDEGGNSVAVSKDEVETAWVEA